MFVDSDNDDSGNTQSASEDAGIQYIYINNTWKKFGKTRHDSDNSDWELCQEEEGRDSCESIEKSEVMYCGGIPGTSLHKDGKPTGDYKCRYNHWVCNSLDGCKYTQNGMENSIREIGMVCDQSECACGNSVCTKGDLCRDGRCIIGESDPRVNLSHSLNHSDYDGILCINESGCKCNDKTIKFKETYVLSMPCYGDGRLDENGCFCGDIKLNHVQNETCVNYHDQYYVLCNHPEGCTCGETKCPMSSYCSQDQCIDPLTEKPIEKSSAKLGLATPCTDEQCPCADSTCNKGQFCYGAACHDNIYANILHGKRYFYDERGIKLIETPDASDHNRHLWDVDRKFDWNFIQSYDMSARNPENLPLDEYGFIPYYHSYHECCGSSEPVFKEGELRCMLESGCACGNHSCPWGAQCIQGKCVYDKQYAEFSCYDTEDVKANHSNCECNGTFIPSYKFKQKNDYDCKSSGWQCSKKTGCSCGDVSCAVGQYCLRPGICTKQN